MKPYLNGAKPMNHSVSSAGDQEQVNVADSLSVFHLVLPKRLRRTGRPVRHSATLFCRRASNALSHGRCVD